MQIENLEKCCAPAHSTIQYHRDKSEPFSPTLESAVGAEGFAAGGAARFIEPSHDPSIMGRVQAPAPPASQDLSSDIITERGWAEAEPKFRPGARGRNPDRGHGAELPRVRDGVHG